MSFSFSSLRLTSWNLGKSLPVLHKIQSDCQVLWHAVERESRWPDLTSDDTHRPVHLTLPGGCSFLLLLLQYRSVISLCSFHTYILVYAGCRSAAHRQNESQRLTAVLVRWEPSREVNLCLPDLRRSAFFRLSDSAFLAPLGACVFSLWLQRH